MDSFSTMGFIICCFTISIYAVLVESHFDIGRTIVQLQFIGPPLAQPPHAHPPSSPPRAAPKHRDTKGPPNHNRDHFPPPPPPAPAFQMNPGKKVGLLFAGIAGIMQIGVVVFLVFKRRQLLKTKDIQENCS